MTVLPILTAAARELGIDLNGQTLERFQRYYELLAGSARRAALTSVTSYQGVQQRHFVESLALLAALRRADVLEPGSAARTLDLGTGAGLPGLPMKLAHPELALTLLEATAKKAAFLSEVVQDLGLQDVEVVTARAEEEAHRANRRETYDLVVARAVAPLPVLLELALPFLRLGGYLAASKGSAARREVAASARALAVLGGEVLSMAALHVPGARVQPTLVLVRKVAPTPPAYPRRAGIPAKRPL